MWGLPDSSKTPSPGKWREVSFAKKWEWQLNNPWPFDGVPGGVRQSRINHASVPGDPASLSLFAVFTRMSHFLIDKSEEKESVNAWKMFFKFDPHVIKL